MNQSHDMKAVFRDYNKLLKKHVHKSTRDHVIECLALLGLFSTALLILT